MEGTLGEIRGWAGRNRIPSGWMLCQGQTLPVQNYQALYSILGTTYGGNGTQYYALPDFQGRVPIGTGIYRDDPNSTVYTFNRASKQG